MATVIAVYNSDGCVGRCDAKCHNAEGGDCDCICGGAYHGSKRNGTFDVINRLHGEAVMRQAEERAREQGLTVKFTDEAQPTLIGYLDS